MTLRRLVAGISVLFPLATAYAVFTLPASVFARSATNGLGVKAGLFGSKIGQRYQQLHRQILMAAEQTDTNA